MMRDPIFPATAVLALAVLGLAYGAERFAMAIYALSFWHYLVYALAFFWRRIEHERFIRDSLTLRTMSLIALAAVLVTTVPSVLSIVVMAAGFALNFAAVRALGKERTYYGYELAALPPERITAFPYSVTAHPMLIANMLAFGGALLDQEFREIWWPLGFLHVILNLVIILIEAYGDKNRSAGRITAITGLACWSALLLIGFASTCPQALATAALILAFGAFLTHRYA